MFRGVLLIVLLLSVLLQQSWSFLQSQGSVHRRGGALFAKKGGGGDSKGFAPAKSNLANLVVSKKDGGVGEIGSGGGQEASGSSANEAEAIDAIFKKYGINDDPNRAAKAKAAAKAAADAKGAASGADAPFGESIIARLTPEMQMKYDNVLVTGVSLSLSFVVLCGVGISAGSLKVVFPDINLPAGLDDVITNFLTPSFTPGLGVFFLFSTSFGLFKFAQISSSQTVYKE